MMLQLADRSYLQPEGKIEEILVRVYKFIFPVDFLILDFETDEHAPIILGRPLLATGRILIDCEKEELVIRVNDQHANINVFPGIKRPKDLDECKLIRVINYDAKTSCLGMHRLENYMLNLEPGDGAPDEQLKSRSKSKIGQKRKLNLKSLKIFHKGKTKCWHDRRLMPRHFLPGQAVLLFNSRLKLFPCKLKSRWTRPYEVVKASPYRAIMIKSLKEGHDFKVNCHKLKYYNGAHITRDKELVTLSDA
ncbi:hypothetical protein GQ457_05G020540 [Hibiscus cannabinus]